MASMAGLRLMHLADVFLMHLCSFKQSNVHRRYLISYLSPHFHVHFLSSSRYRINYLPQLSSITMLRVVILYYLLLPLSLYSRAVVFTQSPAALASIVPLRALPIALCILWLFFGLFRLFTEFWIMQPFHDFRVSPHSSHRLWPVSSTPLFGLSFYCFIFICFMSSAISVFRCLLFSGHHLAITWSHWHLMINKWSNPSSTKYHENQIKIKIRINKMSSRSNPSYSATLHRHHHRTTCPNPSLALPTS